MAKAGQLAGLAALGALAYMNRDKLGMGDKGTTDSNPTRGAGYDSTKTSIPDTGDETGRLLARSPTPDYSNEGRGAAPNMNIKPRAVNPSPVAVAPAVGGNANYGNEGRGSKAPVEPINPDYGNEGRRSQSPALMAMNEANGADTRSANRGDQLAGVSRAVKRESNKKQFAQDVPFQESSQKTDAMAVASRAARAADAKRRAAKQSAYKSGGAVKKMASGGMTSKTSPASKRADGIASKGKTRCKMY